MVIENIIGKGENASNKHFLNFSHGDFWSIFFKINSIFEGTFNLSSTNAFKMDKPKTLPSSKELTFSLSSPCFYVSAVQV